MQQFTRYAPFIGVGLLVLAAVGSSLGLVLPEDRDFLYGIATGMIGTGAAALPLLKRTSG